eukprot:7689834-Pyramimonas_sp.AAC.1
MAHQQIHRQIHNLSSSDTLPNTGFRRSYRCTCRSRTKNSAPGRYRSSMGCTDRVDRSEDVSRMHMSYNIVYRCC